jgi:hypothetical protein
MKNYSKVVNLLKLGLMVFDILTFPDDLVLYILAVSYRNKNDHNDTTEILLKVALNTITLILII